MDMIQVPETGTDWSWGEWVGLSVASHWGQETSFTGWSGYDKEKGYAKFAKEGKRWAYFATSATAIVVEVDILTEFYQMLKTFLVMDLGEALNPAIEIV